MGEATGSIATGTARPQESRDRFDVLATLGSGGVGVVYRAFDRARSATVALKALRRVEALDLLRFKREFRTLADIVHPNLATLYELHTAGNNWFFTMELIEGVPFIRYVRPHEPLATPVVDDATRTSGRPETSLSPRREHIVSAQLDEQRLRHALAQLVDGVHALHLAGKLHRDLKPSNVLVEPGGRVVLLDFGLVSDMSDRSDTGDSLAGTPAYMSPEQASGVPLDEAADWYSVGVMLHEALTGRRPFEGTGREIITAKLTDEPAPLRALAPDASEELVALCEALLQRDPTQRPDAAGIYQVLGSAPSPATLALTGGPPAFVGRAPELASLHAALDESRRGPTAVILRGVSGMGKSSLMRHFLQEADGLVLEGRCYQRESVPYNALDTVIDALTSHLARLDEKVASALLPREIQSLARLFPVVRRVSVMATPTLQLQPPDPVEVRRRAFGALRLLLDRLAAEQPVIVAIDDLQWGDADSAAFLAELIHHPKAPPILLLATYRDDDGGDDSAVLSALRRGARASAIHEIVVGALDDDDALSLLVQTAGKTGDVERARALVRDCGGSPFFLTELARGAGAPGDRADVRLDHVLTEHVARLPDDARALLQLCAIAARPVGAALALRAAGIEREGSSVATLRAERLIRLHRVDDAQRIEPYHDRIRDAVVAGLDAATRRRMHRSLAEALEADGSDREALVDHWRDAGELERAGRHAIAAGLAAEEALAFHHAARLYTFALAHAKTGDDGQPIDVRALRTRLGQVLVLAGRLDEAADIFAAAAVGATGEEALELRRLEVEQRLRTGQLDQALAGMQDLLEAVGCPLPASRGGRIAKLLAQSVALRLRGDGLRKRPKRPLTPEFDRRIHVLWSMAIGMAFVNPIVGRLLQLRLWRDALDSGQKNYQAIAMSMSFGYLASAGMASRPRVEAIRDGGLALANELDEAWLEGWIQGGSGLASYLYGRWGEARERLATGHQILRDRCVGVRWQLDIIEIYLTATLWCMGDTAELVRLVPLLIREAQERGDRLSERGLRSWRSNSTWLVLDQPDEAEDNVAASVAPRQPGEVFQLKHYYELMARTQIDLYRGDGMTAHRRCTEAWHDLERSLMLGVQSVRLESWFLRGRAALAAAAQSSDRELLREAERAAKAIERDRVPWAMPFGLALRAGVAHQRGDTDHAERLSIATADGFAASDMALYAAAAQRRLGTLIGGDEGASRFAAATASMVDGKVADPARITAMLLPGWK